MAKLSQQLSTLKTKTVTVSIVGVSNADGYGGTLSDVGDDYLELDNSADQTKVLIPFSAIAAVLHRGSLSRRRPRRGRPRARRARAGRRRARRR